jgi:hypothetical protein
VSASEDFSAERRVAYNICYNDFQLCATWLPKPGMCRGDNELRTAERIQRIGRNFRVSSFEFQNHEQPKIYTDDTDKAEV